MRLKVIGMKDFKGGNEDVKLTGIDIFTGMNGTGKTRIQQAIQLALGGCVPNAIEEKNIDLIELFTKRADVNVMVVNAEFDMNNFSIERRFELKRKDDNDSVSQTIGLIPDASITGVKACEQKIVETIGSFPYMLNIHEFVRLSDEERFKLLFSLCRIDAEKFTLPVVRERMKVAAKPYLPENAKDNPEALKLLEDMGKFISGDLQGSMMNALEWLKKKLSEFNKTAKQFNAATLGAVNLDKQTGKQSLRHVETIQSDIETAQGQERELMASIFNAQTTKTAIERLDGEKKQLREQIESARLTTGVDRIEAIKKQIEATRLNIQDTTELENKIKGIGDNLAELQQESSTISSDMPTLRNEIARLTKAKAELESGHCPTCGQEAGEVVSSIATQLEEKKAELREYESALQKVTDKYTEASTLSTDYKNNLYMIQKDNESYSILIGQLEHQLSSLNGKTEGIATLETRLRTLEQRKIEGTSLNIGEAELQLEGIRTRIKNLEKEFRDKVEYDQKIRLMKESALKAKQTVELLNIVKALIAEVLTVRREMVQSALEPVKSEAAELLNTIGIDVTFDFQFTDQLGNDVFKFGWKVQQQYGEVFIDFDSLSTAQQMFTLVSLLAPLIHRGNPKLRMLLLDNCEVIHLDYRNAFVQLLAKAHGRFLDNIVVASSADYFGCNVATVQELGKAVTA